MTELDSLATVLPADAVAEAIDPSLWDRVGSPPESVASPGTAEEVADVMAWASREEVGVLPIASGSHTGSWVREGRYVALCTERLSGVEIYEPADLTLTAGAGTPMRLVDEALRSNDQWTPFDPPDVHGRSLGGLAAAGESGPLWMGYGDLRNHVLGMTVVTGDGRTVELGGRVVKNVAGFDLLKLMVGSRGSLGVITSVCLRAFPLPSVDRVVIVRADRAADLISDARAVGTAPVMPVSSVLVDRLDALGPGAGLLIRLHGQKATVDADQATLERHLDRSLEVLLPEVAHGPDGVLAALRDHPKEASVVLEATALPSSLGDLLPALDALDPASIHVDTYRSRARVGLDAFDRAAVQTARDAIERLGGSLRVARAPFGEESGDVDSEPSPDEKDLVLNLRRTFDPAGVLWPAWR